VITDLQNNSRAASNDPSQSSNTRNAEISCRKLKKKGNILLMASLIKSLISTILMTQI
jgi:hypothetical protein